MSFIFKADIEYMAIYTALFNEIVVNPDYKQMEIIEIAIKALDDKYERTGINYPKEIKYLIGTWLSDDESLSIIESIKEKLLYLQTAGNQYLTEKENEEHGQKLAARESLIRLSAEIDSLILSLKTAIDENSKMSSNRKTDIIKHNRISMCFRRFHQIKFDGLTSDDVYYRLACNKEFGQILFVDCMNCWSIKYELLWRCVKKKDVNLLKYYENLIITKCTCDSNSLEWSTETQKTLSWLVNAFETDLDIQYGYIDKEKVKETVIMFVNEIIPFLDKSDQNKVKFSFSRLN